MSHDEMIAVIQAHKEGRKIECRSVGEKCWVECEPPLFSFQYFEYRIKPEPPKPREWWFVRNIGKDSRWAWSRYDVFQNGVEYFEQVHVREVLE